MKKQSLNSLFIIIFITKKRKTMKKTQIIILILFLSINIFAQNWQPVNKTYIYNYQIDTTDYITNTIKVDSVEIIEGDSVFYFNRIMTNCDTCSNNEDNYFALKNQPQFLMREMVKKSDSLFIFQDTSEFIIMPLLKFGQSWIYNEENNISAVISYEGETEIFDIVDSVKTISLSNGKTITISKKFGIIQFYAQTDNYYTLVGIEGNTNFGEHLPNFWDFFNYDVGDVFQKKSSGGENTYVVETIEKYEILSKNISLDTIRYEVSGWTFTIDFGDYGCPDSSIYELNTTLEYIDSLQEFSNKHPNELANIAKYTDFYNGNSWLNKVEIYKEDGFYVKKIGDLDYNNANPYYTESFSGSDLLIRNYGIWLIELKCRENLGLDFCYSDLAWEENITMGKVHNGDTVGIVYPDSFFQNLLKIQELNTQNISIFPNPITNGQTLQIKSDEEILTYNIYNISGQKVLSGNINNNKININNLQTGIYIIELNTNNKIIREKLIVK